MLSKNSFKNSKTSVLKWRFFIVVTTIGGIALAIFLGNQVYGESKKMAIEQFNQQQLILARSASAGIETYFNGFVSELFSLAKLPGAQHITHKYLEAMHHAYSAFPEKTSIRLLDSNGVLRSIYPNEGWRKELIGKDYSKKAYFQETMEARHVISSRLINNEHDEQRIRVAVPIYRANKTEVARSVVKDDTIAAHTDLNEQKPEKLIGVIVGSFAPKTIGLHYILPVVSGKTGYAWLLNQNGTLLVHHEDKFFGMNAFEVRAQRNPDICYKGLDQIQRKMLAGEEGVGRYISGWHRKASGEIEKLVAYTPVHINDKTWSIAVCAPVSEVDEIMRTTYRSEQHIIIFVILLLTTAGIFFSLISFRWTRSLELEVTIQTKELRETSEYLNNLIMCTNAPTIVWNSDRQITVFNKAFEKMTGWTEPEMMELQQDLLFPEESRFASMKKLGSAFTGKNWEIIEIPILCKDGEIRIGLWNSANIYAEDGKKVIATVAQGQDITERKQVEKALKESNTQKKYLNSMTRLMCDNLPDLIWTKDLENRFIFANKECCEKLLNSRDTHEPIGKTCLYFANREKESHPENPEYHTVGETCMNSDVLVLETKKPQKFEEVGNLKGKFVCLDVYKAPFWDEKDNLIGTVGCAKDITREKEIEKDKLKLESQLQQAQKMESLGTLAGGIAHDFNNILFPISGYTEMLLQDAPEDSQLKQSLIGILQGIKRAGDLVKQILTFSRQRERELKPLKVEIIVKEALKLVRSSLPTTIEILQNINKDCGLVMADPTQIHQVVMNLCTNAFHAIEETGGKLTITLKKVELAAENLKNPAIIPGPHACLMVADTGPGLEQSIIDRIFDPYFTTKEEGKGTGLGLSVVHGIVKSHGGHLSVYSEPGKGAVFEVYLPVMKEQKKTAKVETDAPIIKGDERILLVDDEGIISQMEKQMLERLGYHVTAQTSSIEALEAFRAIPHNFDLVITDLTMPNMTGDKLAEKLIAIRPDIPVILCTGFSEKISEENAKALGIKGFLMKPIIMRDLAKTIREVLEKNQWSDKNGKHPDNR